MKFFSFIFFIIIITGCQKPPVSIQPFEGKKTDTEKKQDQIIDQYLDQLEQDKNVNTKNPNEKQSLQEQLEGFVQDSRNELANQNNSSNHSTLIENPLHSRSNTGSYSKSLESRFLGLQEETAKDPQYMGAFQSYNDHILTQLLQGILFSPESISTNDAIERFKSFFLLNLFPNYDEPFWVVFRANEPLRNIEFFESAAVLAKTSLLSTTPPLKLYEQYFLPIKLAYNSYFELDNDFEIEDYLALAYLTEQYVYYRYLTLIDTKTASDFISLIDNYNCQLNEDYINIFLDKIACFKTQNYVDSSLSFAASLYSPDKKKIKSDQAFDFNSDKSFEILKQLDTSKQWSTILTDSSKLKLSGLLIWSNLYNNDNGQSVISSFKDIYQDLMASNVVDINIKFVGTDKKKNKQFELRYELKKNIYSKQMFDLKQQEQIQAIAIELTRASMGLY